jgi:hypothetical protein
MHRYALRSATNKIGIESSDPSTPRCRALSESSVPRPSPEMEPKGDNPGVPPYASPRSYRDAALARPPTSPVPMGAGETRQRLDSNNTIVRTISNVTTLPGQFTLVTPEVRDDDEGPWTVVRPRSRRKSRETMPSDDKRSSRGTQFRKQRHVKHNVSSIDYGRSREVTLDESTGTKDKYYKDTLREVERTLSTEDKRKIHRRVYAESTAREIYSSETTGGESAPRSKGKGVDPGNWGDIELDEAERNVDQQRAVLREWNERRLTSSITEASVPPTYDSDGDEIPGLFDETESEPERKVERKAHRKSKAKAFKMAEGTYRMTKGLYGLQVAAVQWAEKERSMASASSENNPIKRIIQTTLKTKDKSPRKSATRVIEPAHQIAPTSYLGKALERVKGKRQRARDSDSSGGSSSSSSSSDLDSSSDDESSLTTSSSSSSNHRRRPKKRRDRNVKGKRARHHRKRSKSRGRDKKNKSGYGKLKPIAPTKYDGSPDSRAYHRFLMEGAAYVEAGRVESERQVFVLSHYLTGKAHEFYIREVAGDPYSWGLQEFFLELFNSCFPVDFRTKQRRKLGECLQRGRTVREYVSELYELWNLIGDVGEREIVTKLWNGFQYWIQSELWKDKLNPEKSSLREVIAAAEVIEIAHSVGGNNNKRSSFDSLSLFVSSFPALAFPPSRCFPFCEARNCCLLSPD